MKKAWIIFLMVAFMAMSLFVAGCGGSKPSQTPSSSPAGQPAEQKQETVADLFAKGKKISGMSYDYSMKGKEEQAMTGKMWISGKKIKSEMTIENNKMSTIIDGEAKVAYMYNPAEKSAIKIPLDQAKTADTPDKFTNDADAAKVKVLETTTYEGVKCRVLMITDEKTKVQTKMWVREDYGVPMRVEVIEEDRTKMVMEYKNMKFGPISADEFQLPAGVEVTDMGEMMKKMMPKQ